MKVKKYCLVRHVGHWEILSNGKRVIYGNVDFEEVIYSNDDFFKCWDMMEDLENGNPVTYTSDGKWYSYDVLARKDAKRQGLI